MKKLNYVLVLLTVLCYSSSFALVSDFQMGWVFTNADGTAEGYAWEDICFGESVYLKNTSTYNNTGCNGQNAAPIGNLVSTGYYKFTINGNVVTPIGGNPSIPYQMPASSWNFGEVIEIPISVWANYSTQGANFKVQYYGSGSITQPSQCPHARYHTLYISTHAAPTITAAASVSPVCPGSPVILTASGGTNYEWSNGDSGSPIIVEPYTTTTYTVTGEGSYCSATADVTVQVLPAPTLKSKNYVLCQNDPIPTLNAGTGGISYVWHKDSPTGQIVGYSQTFTPPTYGTYCCTKTGSNGCSTTACYNISLDPSVNQSADFSLYIDPFSGNTLNLTATMPALPAGYGFYWQVDELNPSTNQVISSYINPPLWWNYPTTLTFPGYSFYKNHKYRITRGIWSNDGCLTWKQSSVTFIKVSKSKIDIIPLGSIDTGIDIRKAKGLSEEETTSITEFSVYPNPSNGVFNISGNEDIQSIRVIDISGKNIMESTPATSSANIDLSSFGKGTYFLKIQTLNNIQTKKIQVN